MQERASGHVKPKSYNAWDILTLNGIIKDKIEDERIKQKKHLEKIELRKYYDEQVEIKK